MYRLCCPNRLTSTSSSVNSTCALAPNVLIPNSINRHNSLFFILLPHYELSIPSPPPSTLDPLCSHTLSMRTLLLSYTLYILNAQPSLLRDVPYRYLRPQ